MRRFLLSGSFLSVLVAGASLLQRTLTGPRSWRTWLLWASWAISLILAIATVTDRRRALDEF